MIKIHIVDDELIFREYLRTVFDWESYGFEIVAESKDGLEALEMVKQNLPDVMLVDINMPFMDGLELIKNLNKKYPTIAIILITGHSEFEYAQRAVRLGVADYLLKPFNKKKLLSVLMVIKDEIYEKKNMDIIGRKKEKIATQWYLNQLLNHPFTSIEAEHQAAVSELFKNFEASVFQVAIIEVDSGFSTNIAEDEMSLQKFIVRNMLEEFLHNDGNNYLLNQAKNRMVAILEFTQSNDPETIRKVAFKRLIQQTKKHFNINVTICLGETQRGIEAIYNSAVKATRVMNERLVSSRGDIIECSANATGNYECILYSREQRDLIDQYLRLHDYSEVNQELVRLFDTVKKSEVHQNQIITIATGLINLCIQFIEERGYKFIEIFGDDFEPIKQVNNAKSIDMIKDEIDGMYKTVIDYCKRSRRSKSSVLAAKAVAYIGANYSDSDLSVGEIASHIYINASYLRKVFKAELGMSVSEYLTRIRMRTAGRLITTLSMKLSEVARQVGYSDPGYFSKCFKKYYGVTPSDYENNRLL